MLWISTVAIRATGYSAAFVAWSCAPIPHFTVIVGLMTGVYHFRRGYVLYRTYKK